MLHINKKYGKFTNIPQLTYHFPRSFIGKKVYPTWSKVEKTGKKSNSAHSPGVITSGDAHRRSPLNTFHTVIPSHMARHNLHIRYYAMILLCTLLLPLMTQCDEKDDFEELPVQIQKFVAKYYPETAVSNYDFSNGIYHVTLNNSATMEFNSSIAWTSIDGRGATLPEMLLYDQLPSPLYSFLESTGNTASVYRMSRNASIITLGLLDSTAVYDIATGKITN